MRLPARGATRFSRRQFLATSGRVMAGGILSDLPVKLCEIDTSSRGPASAAGLGTVGNSASASEPLIAFRIFPGHWLTEDRFRGLLDFLSRQPGSVDELAFFTSATHALLPINEIERRAPRLAELLPRVRARGFGAGINVLATLSHLEENLSNSPSSLAGGHGSIGPHMPRLVLPGPPGNHRL